MPTRAQLAQRRALVTAAKRRRPARPMPTAQPPRPTAYVGALRDVAEELNDVLGSALSDTLGVRVDAADDGMPAFNRRELLARLTRLAESIVKRRGSFLDRAIDACAETVATRSKAEWAKQAQAVVGIDLSKVEPTLTPTINRFRRANLDLITSVARDKVERVKRILDDNAGARVETIRDRIMEEQGVTKRQAALIARDQVLSLNAQVTEARHAAAGVTEYIWRTSGDGDVRPAHKALEGKRFRYDEPPIVDAKTGRRENPGQDYQCRCTAEPVIDGFEEGERTDAAETRTDWDPAEHPTGRGHRFIKKGAGGGPRYHKPPKNPPPQKSWGGGGASPPAAAPATTASTAAPAAPAPATAPAAAKPPHVLKAEADATNYANSLKKPHERKAFEDSVATLYDKSGHAREDVARLVSGAVKAEKRGVNPTEYLKDAHAIASRPGISQETVRCLGANAVGQNPWDLGFINRTKLTDAELDFLAGDRSTSWPKWKRAADLKAHLAKNPSPPAPPPTAAEAKRRERTMRQANLSIRGASAEMLAGQHIKTLTAPDGVSTPLAEHSVSGRQIPLDGKVLDYEIKGPPPPPGGRKRYMEVKAVAHDTWKNWLGHYQRREDGEKLTANEHRLAAKIDGLCEQMSAAARATHPGERPVLALTSAMRDAPTLAELTARMKDRKISPEIVFMTENDIVETGRGLRARLGFGKP